MTTLFPIFGFRAAVQRGCDSGAREHPGGEPVFDLALLRRRAANLAGVDEFELHAYVDACLDAGRRARVEAELAQNADAGLAAATYRMLNINLHRLFDRDMPPLSASLEALSREFERRLAAFTPARSRGQAGRRAAKAMARFASALGRGAGRIPARLRGGRMRVDLGSVLGRIAEAVHRAPLASVVVVASFIALVGLAWPLVAGHPASCAERVEVLAKAAAKKRVAPELGERLATTGLLCGGDRTRAEAELARLEYETRRVGN